MYHINEEHVFCLESSFLKSPEGDTGSMEERRDIWGLVPRALLPPNGVPTARVSPGNRAVPGLWEHLLPFPFGFDKQGLTDYLWDIRQGGTKGSFMPFKVKFPVFCTMFCSSL